MIVWFWSQRTFCFSLAFCYLLVLLFFCMTPCLSSEWCYLMSCPEILRFIKCSHSLPPVFAFFLPRSPFSCALFYFVNCCSLCYSCCYSVLPNRASHLLLLTLLSGVFFNCTPDIKTMPNYQKKAAAG